MVCETQARRNVLHPVARVGLVVCALGLMGASRPPSPRELGRQLFSGELSLNGRMVGHSQVLPQQALRCTNCHQGETLPSPPPLEADSTTQDFGPKLNASTLAHPRARRGGPASLYDAKSFCRLLRDGIDPAHVMIPQTMPRYVFNDAECEALWTFLVSL